MVRMTGRAIYKGIAMGPIQVMQNRKYQVRCEKIEDVEEELRKVHSAKELAVKELQGLYEKALEEVGESYAAIFKMHQVLLEDEDYLKSVENIICTQRVNAVYAVTVTGNNFAELFAAVEDEYIRSKVADINDVTNRMIRCLDGSEILQPEFTEPVIIVADDLTPSETVEFDRDKILAFVIARGSANSHTAILAKTMNIPALFNVNLSQEVLYSGTEALVDGYTGEFIVKPSREQKEKAQEQLRMEARQKALLQGLKGKEDRTLSGKIIRLYANIGSVQDLDAVLENDAAGVGLFRSEFLYMGRKALPTEEEQFVVYKQAAQKMAGKKLIVRTMDMGADKRTDYLQLEQEENPALGYRAIRICLTRTKLFKTQLRALYRAAVYGNISILYPMIISAAEVEAIRKITKQVKKELEEEQIPYRDVEEGIMIETPAAALISDDLARMVDFFSIGTNDLTQYTLAIDRQNAYLDSFYDAHHKAVLRMIKYVVDNAHKAGIWVGICGELAADIELTPTFVEMGVDELSVAPSGILELRKRIREIY